MLICTSCGVKHKDTGIDPTKYKCGKCEKQTLLRIPDPEEKEDAGEFITAGSIFGVVMGTLLLPGAGTFIGMITGGIAGYFFHKTGKKKK